MPRSIKVMQNLLTHVRKYIIRGLLAIIPLALTYLAVMFFYSAIDQRVVGIIRKTFAFTFPGLGILLVLASLYILGLVASNVAGKQLFHLIEKIMNRVPLVRTTYKVGQQLKTTLSLPDKHIFKKAVLVEYLKPGMWTLGFVTGKIVDRKNKDEILFKVFVPTPPNPTSGTMILVRESETRDPGWSIEEALNSVLSAGIIGPGELR
ncbi:MAG: DUF502 domain-containing protein [Thermodesulfobacteriota bacterium]|nr:DUF502 domain-containing protein [Thermodesulfobacteriota bacterium]